MVRAQEREPIARKSLTMPGKAFLFKSIPMFYIYILYSSSSDKYYVGYTENPSKRLIEHNNSTNTTYTSKHRPWAFAAVYSCGAQRKDAMKLESFIKRQKSSKLIEKLVEGVELSGDLAQLVNVSYLF